MITNLERKLNLRLVAESCKTCRYIRLHTTGCVSAECLLLGRTMAIGDQFFVWDAVDGRICDGWEKRPKTWQIQSEGIDRNPHWTDPYCPREQNIARRERLSKS